MSSNKVFAAICLVMLVIGVAVAQATKGDERLGFLQENKGLVAVVVIVLLVVIGLLLRPRGPKDGG